MIYELKEKQQSTAMNYNTNIKVFEIIKVAGYEIHKFEMVS
jgi:hypothetical protein